MIFRYRYYIVVLLITLLAPCLAAQCYTMEKLGETIDGILESADIGNPTFGVLVQDGESGCIIYEKNANRPLKPASNNKLRTSAAAVYYLGPDFRYETGLYITGEIKDGVLHGDLLVVGKGDPTISGRFAPGEAGMTWTFREWAKELKKLGIKKITGNIIGDDDYFDDDYYAKGWSDGSRGEWFAAEISALSFNDNCVDIHFKGGSKPGKKVDYRLEPDSEYITFINEVETVEKGGRKNVDLSRRDKTNVVVGRGSIPAKEKLTRWASVYNPTAYFVNVLKHTLEEEKIKIEGEALDLDMLPQKEQTLAADAATTLVTVHKSPPMMKMLEIVNTNSQNFYAEQILKTIGKEVKGEGSFLKGAEAVMDFLRKEDLNENGCVMIDGSGLSYLNRTTAQQMVKLLRFLRKHEWWEKFKDTMTRGAVKGSLKNAFNDYENSEKTAKRIYAKTGYIGGVVTLSGVVYNQNGKEIFYSVLINGFSASPNEARKVTYKVAWEIANSRIP